MLLPCQGDCHLVGRLVQCCARPGLDAAAVRAARRPSRVYCHLEVPAGSSLATGHTGASAGWGGHCEPPPRLQLYRGSRAPVSLLRGGHVGSGRVASAVLQPPTTQPRAAPAPAGGGMRDSVWLAPCSAARRRRRLPLLSPLVGEEGGGGGRSGYAGLGVAKAKGQAAASQLTPAVVRGAHREAGVRSGCALSAERAARRSRAQLQEGSKGGVAGWPCAPSPRAPSYLEHPQRVRQVHHVERVVGLALLDEPERLGLDALGTACAGGREMIAAAGRCSTS
jgi:hypothetical protein